MTAHQDVWIDAKTSSLTVCCVGLFSAATGLRTDQRDVDERDVLSTNTELELPERLNVGGRFDIAYRAAKFDDARIGHGIGTVCGSLCNVFYPVLNCIRMCG